MKILQPVIWSNGTILSPQHLQTQDRFVESSLQFRLESLASHPWGFRRLRVSQEALEAGTLAITEASGLFPDGLPFEIPASDPAPPAYPLGDAFDAEREALDVYLAVPAYRDGALNLGGAGLEVDARYVAEVLSVRDENSGTAEAAIRVARKNLRLLSEVDNRDGRSLLRVGRVRRTEAGRFEMDPRVVAPALAVSGSPYLLSIARRLVEILTAKSTMLAGLRRQKNQSLAEFTASDIANFWLLYTVNTHFPQLRSLLEDGRGHPRELFEVMTSLAGSLTTFSLETRPRDLPLYDHDDPGACLGDLDEILRRLLETVVPSNFVSLPLKLARPSVYATTLAEEKYLIGTRLYLAIHAEMDEGELIRKVPELVKICSATHVEHLIRQALPGVELLHVASPPAAIPIKLNYQYFSLSQGGLAWEAICRAWNLAAYVPADFPNPQMELIILLPD